MGILGRSFPIKPHIGKLPILGSSPSPGGGCGSGGALVYNQGTGQLMYNPVSGLLVWCCLGGTPFDNIGADCTNCDDNTTPEIIFVTLPSDFIQGFGGELEFCRNCSNLNGLTVACIQDSAHGRPCIWDGRFTVVDDTEDLFKCTDWFLEIVLYSGGDVELNMFCGTGGCSMLWYEPGPISGNCKDMLNGLVVAAVNSITNPDPHTGCDETTTNGCRTSSSVALAC